MRRKESLRMFRAVVIWLSGAVMGFAVWLILSTNVRGAPSYWNFACFTEHAAINLAEQILTTEPDEIIKVMGCYFPGFSTVLEQDAELIWGPRLDRVGYEISVYRIKDMWMFVVHISHGIVI